VNRLLVVVLAAFALNACGEREQILEPQSEKRYQGKVDSKPWDNEPLAYEHTEWKRGDQASWEAQIKRRQLTQHEDGRIYP
jgi:hypothetical protein